MKIIIFGEVIWDVYPHKKTIGGAPFNFAAHMSLLGNEVYLITATGNDALGREAFIQMENYGIKTDIVHKNSYPTGVCTVTLDENRIPSYNVHTNTAYDNIEISDSDIEKIKAVNADAFYFNTLIQRNAVSENSLKKILRECKFNEIFCDINIREGCYSKDSILLCITKATTLKISDEEIHFLYDTGVLPNSATSLKEICKIYPNIKTLIFTKGSKGSEVYSAKEDRFYVSHDVPVVKVVSTVGAGDCHGATFLSSIYSGDTIDTALLKATQRSARVVASYETIVK